MGGCCPKLFRPPPKNTQDRPGSATGQHPRASGKMVPPEKNPRNEELKVLLEELDERSGEPLTDPCDWQMQVFILQSISMELMELLIEPEEPG